MVDLDREWSTGLNDLGHVKWYGFGGAWGAVGSTSDLTGPLGPSIWKNPFRV